MPADDQVRARLARLVERLTAALWRAYRPGVAQVAADAAAAARAPRLEPDRVGQLVATYRQAMGEAGVHAGAVSAQFATEAARFGLADAAALVAAVGGAPVDAGLVQVANVAEGPLRDLIVARAPGHADRVAQVLVEGSARGWSPYRIAGAVRQAAEGPFRGAVLVARTEAMRAHRTSTLSAYQTNPTVSRWRWSARKTSRTCAACWAKDGTLHGTDRPMGTHPACFVAGTVVSGEKPLAGSARLYTGRFVKVATSAGNGFTATANHPILTPSGWVPAGDLREGGYVVSSAGQVSGKPGDVDEHQRPAPIEQVVAALLGAGRVSPVPVPTSPQDFHGDGVGSQVHVVGADRQLRDGFHATSTQQFRQVGFGGADVRPRLLLADGALGDVFGTERLAPDGVVGGGGVGFPLFRGEGGVADDALLGRGALAHTCGSENTVDDVAGHPVAGGQGQDGGAGFVLLDERTQVRRAPHFGGVEASGGHASADGVAGYPVPGRDVLDRVAGGVFADEIVSVEPFDGTDHVYNLQTVSGVYCAGGVVAHNCMCVMVPVVAGVSDGPAAGPALFARLNTAEQDMILGPAKGAAYRDGAIRLEDVARHTHSAAWGEGLRVATLAELGIG